MESLYYILIVPNCSALLSFYKAAVAVFQVLWNSLADHIEIGKKNHQEVNCLPVSLKVNVIHNHGITQNEERMK